MPWLLVILVTASGCVPLPIPHTITERPKITGTLKLDGKPWAGARLIVTDGLNEDGRCPASAEAVNTGSGGEFLIPVSKKRKYVYVLMLVPYDAIYTVAVCAQYDGSYRPLFLYSGWDRGFHGRPTEVYLECDLRSKSFKPEFDQTQFVAEDCRARLNGKYWNPQEYWPEGHRVVPAPVR